MKKITYVTMESIIGGVVHTGVAEVVDSLANAVSEDVEASVICPDGNSFFVRMAFGIEQKDGYRTCKLLGVRYYLVARASNFLDTARSILDEIQPDVLHNFAQPEVVYMMKRRPKTAVYTIDQADYVRGKEPALRSYDYITTVSKAYAEELLSGNDALAELLKEKDFRGITNGILTSVFNPASGLLLEQSYTADDQTGKDANKAKLCRDSVIPAEKPLYLYMGRLAKEKGLKDILRAVPAIRESGGFLLVVGRGDARYEQALSQYRRDDGVLWIREWASPMRLVPMLAAADFYLSPSATEPCGLMPMTACRYGAIPITTLNGGLRDNMDADIAVIIGEGGLEQAVHTASDLCADPARLAEKRKTAMTRDFSWDTRKAEYLEIYTA